MQFLKNHYKKQQTCWTHSVSDAASRVETGGNVPGAEDAADSHAHKNTHMPRERATGGGEGEGVSDGEAEEGYVWGSQRGMEQYEYHWHSDWLPGDGYYGGKKKGNHNVLSGAELLPALITNCLSAWSDSLYLIGKKTDEP